MERLSSSPERPRGSEVATGERRALPFWVATPVRLARFPAVLFAVAAAAMVLVIATAAGPLFLSSAGAAALSRSLGPQLASPALTVSGFGPITSQFLDPPDRALRRETGSLPELGPPTLSVVADLTARANGRGPAVPVRIITRTGFLWHIERVGQAGSQGLWLTQAAADSLGVKAGDPLDLGAGLQTTSATVAGVYVSLSGHRLPSYWTPLRQFLQQTPGQALPPVILADQATITAVGSAVQTTGRVQWDVPLAARRMSLREAEALAGRLQHVRDEIVDVHAPLGASFQTARFGTSVPFSSTPLPDLVQEATRIIDAITGPVGTIAVAGRLMALLGVAAAGAYVVRRRRVETSLMAAHGVSPALQGLLAATEAAVPAVAGGTVGWFVALGLVRWFGPSRFVEAAAQRSSLLSSGITVFVAVLLLGVAAGVAARLEFEEVTGRAPQVLARIPWEPIVLLLAAAALYELWSRGGAVVSGGLTPKVDRLLLLFPLLCIAGLAGLCVRVIRRVLARARSAGRGWRTPSYLAIRRLAAAPRIALLLITASSLAVGILVYAGMVGASVTSTAAEKARVRVGSDVAVVVPSSVRTASLQHFDFPSTVVSVIDQAAVVPGNQAVDVLEVDPRTFAAGAFWDPGFASEPLATLLARLTPASGPGLRVPAVIAGADVSAEPILRIPGSTVALGIVGRARTLPGMSGRPVILVAASALLRAAPETSLLSARGRRIWAKGSPAQVLSALRRAGIPGSSARTAQDVERMPAFLALSWTFGFLEAMGVVAALVALIGVVLYLQSRQSSREVSYALATRMGLTSRAHRASVALELGGMLLAAFVVGAGLAAGTTRVIYGKLDVFPEQAPAPLFRVPSSLFVAVAGALLVAALAGAAAVQRRAGRANVAEVMRRAA